MIIWFMLTLEWVFISGLKSMKAAGNEEEFIVLEFHGNDRVYIPVNRITLIEKYKSLDDNYKPKIDKLRSVSWENKKSRATKKIKDIAENLLKAHAARKLTSRNRYDEKDDMYFDFENRFKYVETPDQLNAIDDVQKDLSGDRPMDRLVCGDVGFGKTEVAIRAALRVIISGYQVMFIAPTTVLSHQHYVNIKARFEDLGIKVALVNRFVGTKQSRKFFLHLKMVALIYSIELIDYSLKIFSQKNLACSLLTKSNVLVLSIKKKSKP